MTSRKLSESDKQEMLQFYRQAGETTSTLASRYGVSNSTISRILKTSFSEAEYEALIQQKRGGRTASEVPSSLDATVETFAAPASGQVELEEYPFKPVPASAIGVANAAALIQTDGADSVPSEVTQTGATEADATEAGSITTVAEFLAPATTNGRRLRKRSSAPVEPIAAIAPPIVRAKIQEQVTLTQVEALDEASAADLALDLMALDLVEDDRALAVAEATAEAVMGEVLLDGETDLDDDDLDDDLDDELDDDDLDDDLDDDELDDDLEGGLLFAGSRIAGKALVQVLPLAAASLPRTCYLVVDRSAELIARPLKEFGDLGQIPESEILSKTLPIFDNHRIAKRYSNPRTQRVIKLPDAQVLQKTSSHLQAKGITRLLIDGQVYAL